MQKRIGQDKLPEVAKRWGVSVAEAERLLKELGVVIVER